MTEADGVEGEDVDPALLDSYPRPQYPLTEPWGISVADVVSARWPVPVVLRKVLGLLDRFGAVRLSPTGMGIDGTDVPWEDLVEVRLVSLFHALRDDVAEREADRLKVYLPPVPGRGWLVRRVFLLLGALAARFVPAEEEGARLVPLTVVRRGPFGREKEVVGGAAAALLLAAVPEAGDVLVRTARSRQVPVRLPDGSLDLG